MLLVDAEYPMKNSNAWPNKMLLKKDQLSNNPKEKVRLKADHFY